MRTFFCVAIAVIIVMAAGCVRRDGRNSDCKWPGETPLHAPTPRHLSADAEFAEDLAIRYGDVHYGLRSPGYVSFETYRSARTTCMQAMFAAVAGEHGVPVTTVRQSLGRNRAGVDVAEYLPFLIAYCFAAFLAARIIWRRNLPNEVGWISGMVVVLIVALVFAVLATMIGETWGSLAESLRVGTGHLSNRADRILWARHRWVEFVGLLALFLLVSGEAGRRIFREPQTSASNAQSNGAATY